MTTDDAKVARGSEPPKRISLRDTALSSIRIAEPVTLALPNRVTFSNLAQTNPVFAQHLDAVVYGARSAHLDAIDLIRLPRDALVYGGGHFITQAADALLEEQFPPYIGSLVPQLSDVTEAGRPRQQVSGEKLLAARFGLSTWGHWIGELLPKILLTEHFFPKRFQYVLPRHAVAGEHPNSIWSSIQESIVACGISLDRVFPLGEDFDYVFDSLFAVTPIWSDHMIHPAATDVLRNAVRHIPANGPPKLAIVRDAQFRRGIANAEDVYRVLEAHGYVVETTGLRRFVEQVARFKAAGSLFSVLGSDLTNLVFAPTGVTLLSAAPDIFGDRFFYALILDRHGTISDIRGPVVKADEVGHKGTFQIDTAVLASVLEF